MQTYRQIKKYLIILSFAFVLALFIPSGTWFNSSQASTNEAGVSYVNSNVAYAFDFNNPSDVTKILGNKAGNDGDWMRALYKFFLGLVNIVLVAFLVFVAIANIIHYDIENYQIKQVIIKAVKIAIVANLSLPIITLCSRLVDSLMSINIFSPLGVDMIGYFLSSMFGGWQILASAVGATFVASLLVAANFGGFTIAIVLIVAFVVICLLAAIALAFITGFRPYIIFICAAVAPLAIACQALPLTESYYKKWLKIIAVWLILPVLMNFVLRLGMRIPANMTTSSGNVFTWIMGTFMPMVFKLALLFLAIRMPFKLESDVSGVIDQAGKKLSKGAWNLVGWGMGTYAYNKQTERQNNIVAQEERDIRRQRMQREGLQTEDQLDDFYRNNEDAKQADQEIISRRSRYRMDRDRFIQAARLAQQINPYGIMSAWKERLTLGEKNREKAHYRRSDVTATVLGREANYKHQLEISKDDLAHLYNISDVEGYYKGAFQKAVKAYLVKNPAADRATAISEVERMLARIDTTQAGAADVLSTLGQYIQGKDLSDAVAGANRQRQVLMSMARSPRGVDTDAAFADLVRQSNGRLMASGSPDRQASKEAQQEGASETESPEGAEGYDDNTEILHALDQIVTNTAKKPSQQRAQALNISLPNLKLDKISNDSINGFYSQCDSTLEAIMRHLIAKGIGKETAAQFARTLKEKNGLDDLDTSGDAKLDELVETFRAQRLTQLAIQARTSSGTSAYFNALKIGQPTSGQDLAAQQKAIEDSCATVIRSSAGEQIAPAMVSQAKQTIGKIIGLSEEAVDQNRAINLRRGSEVRFSKDQQGQVITVDDPAQLKYRVGIQQERDMQSRELNSHSQDLIQKAVSRRQSGRQIMTSEEEVVLRQKVSAVVEPHMELRYGEQWKSQSPQIKNQVVGSITDVMKAALSGTPESLPGSLSGQAKKIQTTISSSSPEDAGETIGVEVPRLAESMFGRGMNNG